jgi:hypothetical protein
MLGQRRLGTREYSYVNGYTIRGLMSFGGK